MQISCLDIFCISIKYIGYVCITHHLEKLTHLNFELSLIHPSSPHTTCLRAQERLLLEGEAVARGVQDPGVVIGTLLASVEPRQQCQQPEH